MTTPKRRIKFSLGGLLLAFLAVGVGIGVAGRIIYSQSFRSPDPLIELMLREGFTTSDETAAYLQKQFNTTNPQALDGWSAVSQAPNRLGSSWEKEGIVYVDRDSDGRLDMKYRREPHVSTTEIWWEDTNHDGFFDTEVEHGCFHRVTRELAEPIAVPVVPTPRPN